jgi:hypothetical protein
MPAACPHCGNPLPPSLTGGEALCALPDLAGKTGRDLTDAIRAELEEAFTTILSLTSTEEEGGWWLTSGLSDGVWAGDQLVALGDWEKRPGGVGRVQAYRRKRARREADLLRQLEDNARTRASVTSAPDMDPAVVAAWNARLDLAREALELRLAAVRAEDWPQAADTPEEAPPAE